MRGGKAICFGWSIVLSSLFCILVDAQERSAKSNSRQVARVPVQSDDVSHLEELVTGDVEHLGNVVAGFGATLKFYFTPRPPLPGTEPSLAYPAGWNITGQKLTVAGGGFTSAWIAQIEGWNPNHDDQLLLRVFQDKIDANGFKGVKASPPNPGCDLVYPAPTFACQKTCTGGVNAGSACMTNANCPGSTCTDPCPALMGEAGTKCGNTVAGICDWGWQDTTRADWVFAADAPIDQIPAAAIVSPTGPNFAGTVNPETEIFDSGGKFYTGTLLLPVPGCARSRYTIEHKQDETFANGQCQPGCHIRVAALVTGVLEIQLGSCCTEFTTPSSATCTDGLTLDDCNALSSSNLHIFRAGADCTTPCQVECLTTADCDDGLFCNGAETCVDTHCVSGQPPCGLGAVCNDELNICTMEPVPTVSQWGLAILALVLFIAAKVAFRKQVMN